MSDAGESDAADANSSTPKAESPIVPTLLAPTACPPPVPNPRDVPKVITLRTGLNQALPLGVTNPNTALLQALMAHLDTKFDLLATRLSTLETQMGLTPCGAYNIQDDAFAGNNVLTNYTDPTYDHQAADNLTDQYKPTAEEATKNTEILCHIHKDDMEVFSEPSDHADDPIFINSSAFQPHDNFTPLPKLGAKTWAQCAT